MGEPCVLAGGCAGATRSMRVSLRAFPCEIFFRQESMRARVKTMKLPRGNSVHAGGRGGRRGVSISSLSPQWEKFRCSFLLTKMVQPRMVCNIEKEPGR